VFLFAISAIEVIIGILEMKRYFHEELEAVRSHLMEMGERAVESANLALRALEQRDLDIADSVIEGDDMIDAIETRIDEEVARYISLRAPVAKDLRLLFVAVKASHDLERVGDEATSIAKRTKKMLSSNETYRGLGRVPDMCELAISMLKEALLSFIQEEEDIAHQIIGRDKAVDALNRENFKEFVELMKDDPSKVDVYAEMIFISKSFERIADHAKNISEEVYFLLTSQSLKQVIKEETKS